MDGNEPSDPLDIERDLPTTEEDIRVLRELRSVPLGPDWLDRLTQLSEAFPEDLHSRKTSEGWEPFEL